MKELTRKQIDLINRNCAGVEVCIDIDEEGISELEKKSAQFYLICALYQHYGVDEAAEELLWAEKQRVGFQLLKMLGAEND